MDSTVYKTAFAIWVDADSCPIQVRDLIIRFALRLKIPVHFTANRLIPFKKHPLFSMTICETEPDAADNYIVDNSTEGDIAITRDIPLASRLVAKKVCVLNDRGTVFTEKNINEKLAIRNLNRELVENGIMPEKTSIFGKKELNAFANSLDRELQKKLKQQASQP